MPFRLFIAHTGTFQNLDVNIEILDGGDKGGKDEIPVAHITPSMRRWRYTP
jgi:hypothetical protein